MLLGVRSVIVLLVMVTAWAGVPALPFAAGEDAPPTRSRVIEGLPEQAHASGRAGGSRRSEQVSAPIPFSALGFHAPSGARLRYRTGRDGQWGPWRVAEHLDVGQRHRPVAGRAARFSSELQWTGAADELQVEVEGAAPGEVEVHVIDSLGLSASWRLGRVRALGGQRAEAVERPRIVTRAGWGADESLRSGEASYAEVRFGVLHHTVNRNHYTRAEAPGIVRAIYEWHTRGNGWSDIGYNILVDRFGRVYEGRYGGLARGVVGAHTYNASTNRGYNRGSFGIAVIGDFESADVPSAVASALVRTIGWKYEVHGIDPQSGATIPRDGERLRTLVGHRDVDSTACPGDHLHDLLPTLRRQLQRRVMEGLTPLVGDWNGDGLETPGWYGGGRFHYTDDTAGEGGSEFRYGRRGDIPVVGDWDGDGRDTVGIVRPSTGHWYLRDALAGGAADRTFSYGRIRRGDRPVVGDWDGDGATEVGVIRGDDWLLPAGARGGRADWTFRYGRVSRGDVPVVGDWQGDGHDTIGVVRPGDGLWYLQDVLAGGSADRTFSYGDVRGVDRPVVGDWSGSGRDGSGVVRGSRWYLRDMPSGGAASRQYPYRGRDGR